MHTFAFSITKICSQLFILFSVFSFFPASSQISLQILNSGLIEGYALPYSLINHTMCPPSVYSQPNSECYGGWARRAGYVEYIRNTTNLPTILLDIGQVFGLTLFSRRFANIDSAQYMNDMAYSAMSPGNYEFNDGVSGLVLWGHITKFPLLCCNCDCTFEPTAIDILLPYTIINVSQNLSVGVIGWIETITPLLSSMGNIQVLDPISSINSSIQILKNRGINIIIVISRGDINFVVTNQIASQLNDVDVILNGQIDPRVGFELTSPSGNPILVVTQSEHYGTNFTQSILTFTNNGILTSWNVTRTPLYQYVDQTIEAQVDADYLKIEEFASNVLGSTSTDLISSTCRTEECTMGNFVTDVMRKYSGSQICFYNSGALRQNIPVGNITEGLVLETLPFGDITSTFQIRGTDLISVLEHGLSAIELGPNGELQSLPGGGRFLQVSGLIYSWNPNAPIGQRIVSVQILNQAGQYEKLDTISIYSVVASNYLRDGGDGYTMLQNVALPPVNDFGPLIDVLVSNYIIQTVSVDVNLQNRIFLSSLPPFYFQSVEIDLSVIRYVFYGLGIVGFLFVLACLLFIIVYRNHQVLIASTLSFLYLICFGILLGYGGYFALVSNVSTATCGVYIWFLSISFSISYGCLFIKNWRIFKIFSQTKLNKRLKITNLELLFRLALLVGVDLFILTVWWIFDQPTPQQFPSPSPEYHYIECSSKAIDVFFAILIIYKFTLLIWGIFISFKVRNVTSVYNEAKFIGFAIYGVTFIAIITIPIVVTSTDYQTEFIVSCVAVLCALIVVTSCIFLPKAYQTITRPPSTNLEGIMLAQQIRREKVPQSKEDDISSMTSDQLAAEISDINLQLQEIDEEKRTMEHRLKLLVDEQNLRKKNPGFLLSELDVKSTYQLSE